MARAAAEPQQVMVALTSFVGAVGSFEISIREGFLFPSDDPIVKKYPTLFGPVVLRHSTAAPIIEQATAAPGEKRGA
jgi:hypothetical protein